MSKRKHTHNTTNKVALSFAALGSYVESRIVEGTESLNRTNQYIEWGRGNDFPQYLLSLYRSVASLRSVINGSTDYVVGNGVNAFVPALSGAVNPEKMTIAQVVGCLAKDYYIYGGFALEIGRNGLGEVVSIRPLDFSKLRTDKHNDAIYYSDDWSARRAKFSVYPAYSPTSSAEVSVVYVKNTHYQTYPEPLYVAAIKACEVERCIDTYHLNAINNNFSASYVVNFNNGVPEDEQMREIEEQFVEKFTGQENAGRIAFSWNASSENATTLQKLEQDNFGDRYTALAKHSRQQIYTSFRANPNLFGIPTDNLGFSSEEYAEAFKLYNRTQIRPVQSLIVDTFERVFGKGCIEIVPFDMEESHEEVVE